MINISKRNKSTTVSVRVADFEADEVRKSAEFQGISMSEVVRQSHFFGLPEPDYYRILDIAKHGKVEPKMPVRQSVSFTDMLMGPETTVGMVLKSTEPDMLFADAMRSRPDLLGILFKKVKGRKIA